MRAAPPPLPPAGHQRGLPLQHLLAEHGARQRRRSEHHHRAGPLPQLLLLRERGGCISLFQMCWAVGALLVTDVGSSSAAAPSLRARCLGVAPEYGVVGEAGRLTAGWPHSCPTPPHTHSRYQHCPHHRRARKAARWSWMARRRCTPSIPPTPTTPPSSLVRVLPAGVLYRLGCEAAGLGWLLAHAGQDVAGDRCAKTCVLPVTAAQLGGLWPSFTAPPPPLLQAMMCMWTTPPSPRSTSGPTPPRPPSTHPRPP